MIPGTNKANRCQALASEVAIMLGMSPDEMTEHYGTEGPRILLAALGQAATELSRMESNGTREPHPDWG